ncbi:uncharacterized protein EV420DRAFT_1282020, partial [Desarmillaria tabescens]
YIGGDGLTTDWEHAPTVMHDALTHIKESLNSVFDNVPDFNELLSIAYLPDQKMAFHSDDERGVYPFVVGLSLGSDAAMMFRTKDSSLSGTRVFLTVNLKHGDILLMEGEDFQNCFQHSVTPIGFRIAATARLIEGETE